VRTRRKLPTTCLKPRGIFLKKRRRVSQSRYAVGSWCANESCKSFTGNLRFPRWTVGALPELIRAVTTSVLKRATENLREHCARQTRKSKTIKERVGEVYRVEQYPQAHRATQLYHGTRLLPDAGTYQTQQKRTHSSASHARIGFLIKIRSSAFRLQLRLSLMRSVFLPIGSPSTIVVLS